MDITNIPTAAYHAKTLAGLEQLVADELLAHGATEIKIGRRGVGFTATAEVMYRHCMHARFTLKVLRILYQFQAKHTDDLYRMAARKKWEDVLKEDGTLTIDSTIYSDHFTHDQFAVLRLKDAIVDRFRAKKGERPSIDRQNPDVRIHLHISREDVTISLDACGEPLSKRGYRSRKAIAPLNEVLAAGLLALSGWQPGIPLYDPMCGSGTFTCEAALWASGMPVQMNRSHFAFMEWMNFNRSAWIAVRDEAMDFNPPIPTAIYASDISGDEIDFFQSEPQSTEGGVVVINPPYGERMEPENIDEMYAAIGDRLKFHWPGFKAWIISSNPEAIKNIGLKSNHRHKVHNGPLECRWLGYELYAGSRFADKK